MLRQSVIKTQQFLVVCYLLRDTMPLRGVICVSLCLAASGHRIGVPAMSSIQRIEKDDIIAQAASGVTLPELAKKFSQEELEGSVLGNVVKTFSSLSLKDYTMLHMSSAAGDTTATEALLDAGADVNAESAEDGKVKVPFTPTDLAKTPLVEALLTIHGGTRVNYHHEHQALCDAADMGYPHLAQLLVAAGWDKNVRCKYTYTPLHIAANCPEPGSKWAGQDQWPGQGFQKQAIFLLRPVSGFLVS